MSQDGNWGQFRWRIVVLAALAAPLLLTVGWVMRGLAGLDSDDAVRSLRAAISQLDGDGITEVLQRGGDVNERYDLPGSRMHGLTPLLHAIIVNDAASMEVLLAFGADVELGTPEGDRPLAVAATTGNIYLIDRLSEAGADVNAAGGPLGGTALMYAARRGYSDVVRRLLELGADLGSRAADDRTAAHFAAMAPYPYAFDVIAEAGADLTATTEAGYSVLHAAVQSCDPARIERVVGLAVNVNSQDQRGTTALRSALACPHKERLEIVNALLRAGADPNIPDRSGITPLMSIVGSSESLAAMALLLDAGADVHLKDGSRGWTVLHFIAEHGRPDEAELLLRSGADPLAVSKTGLTPVDMAVRKAQQDPQPSRKRTVSILMSASREER